MNFIVICTALMFRASSPEQSDYNCVRVTPDMAIGMVDACMHDPMIECLVSRGKTPSNRLPVWAVVMYRLESQATPPAPTKKVGSDT